MQSVQPFCRNWLLHQGSELVMFKYLIYLHSSMYFYYQTQMLQTDLHGKHPRHIVAHVNTRCHWQLLVVYMHEKGIVFFDLTGYTKEANINAQERY